MKKYLATIVVAAVIVLVIGTFYIHSAISASQNPEFVIKKQSGDASEINGLVVNGYIDSDVDSEYVQITENEAMYESEHSFLERMKGVNRSPVMKRLEKEHRHFMRGKIGYGNVYEDEQFLVYADTDYQMSSMEPRSVKFDIAILDKNTGKDTSIIFHVPKDQNLDFADSMNVQLVNNELKLITRNMVRESGDINDEIHVYSFDIQSQKLLGDNTILSAQDPDENSSWDISILNETDSDQPQDYVVFRMTEYQEIQREDNSYEDEELSNELIAYNLETDEKKVISLPEELQELERVHLFDGTNLYFMKPYENGVKVVSYNIKEAKINNEFPVDILEMEGSEESPYITNHNGRLYVLTQVTNSRKTAKLSILDIKSGEPLYEGEIVRKTPPEDGSDDTLYLTGIEIQQ